MKKISWNREEFWQGCILASIAHAISVAHYPEIAHEWIGYTKLDRFHKG